MDQPVPFIQVSDESIAVLRVKEEVEEEFGTERRSLPSCYHSILFFGISEMHSCCRGV